MLPGVTLRIMRRRRHFAIRVALLPVRRSLALYAVADGATLHVDGAAGIDALSIRRGRVRGPGLRRERG